jgi:hypothetical protein
VEHIGTIFVVVVLAFFVAIIALLTFAQFRSAAPNAYHCRRCNADFTKPAHHDFPARCPQCGARDWARSTADGGGG